MAQGRGGNTGGGDDKLVGGFFARSLRVLEQIKKKEPEAAKELNQVLMSAQIEVVRVLKDPDTEDPIEDQNLTAWTVTANGSSRPYIQLKRARDGKSEWNNYLNDPAEDYRFAHELCRGAKAGTCKTFGEDGDEGYKKTIGIFNLASPSFSALPLAAGSHPVIRKTIEISCETDTMTVQGFLTGFDWKSQQSTTVHQYWDSAKSSFGAFVVEEKSTGIRKTFTSHGRYNTSVRFVPLGGPTKDLDPTLDYEFSAAQATDLGVSDFAKYVAFWWRNKIP